MRALAVALVVFAIVAGFGLLTHEETPLAVGRATAIRLAAAAPETRVAAAHADSVMVIPIDHDFVKVTWLRHGRTTATAGVKRDGTLAWPSKYKRIAGYGAPLSHGLLLLGALTALFLLATLRGPLRRRRTLDVAVLAAAAVPTVLIDRGLLALGEGMAAVLIAYLVLRGIELAVRGPGPAAEADDDAPVLLERLAARAALPGLPRQVGLLLLFVTVLMTLTSTGVVDVAYANMEGATVLLTGHLPYGHMPADVIHGDTYGLPIYALYAPFAALWPVHTDWDDALGALVLGAGAAIVCALGMVRATGGARWPSAIALLALPASLMTFSSGTNDVLIAAALIWALAWWSRPAASSALLALAGLAKVAPLVLLPLWLARLRGAALLRALAACAGVGALVLAGLLALGGLHGPQDMVHAMAFQLDRRSMMSIWTAFGIEPLQPLVQGAALAIALGGATLVWLDRSVAADPRRVAGLVAATLGALQLAANHWAPLYLLWLAPPAMVALLGPLGARATVAEPATSPAAVPASARLASI